MREKMNISRSQEFLSLREDIKPVMRKNLESSTSNYMTKSSLNQLCKKYGFQFLIKNFNNIRGEKFKNVVYISKSKELARQAYEAEKNIDVKKLGELLGYPECCVKFYDNYYRLLARKIKKNENFSFVKLILNETESKPKFYLNNIFNFQSRIFDKILRYEKLLSMNKEINRFHIISHVPCSYDCKESIKIAKRILKIMKTEIPRLREDIIIALKRPFLFFDDFKWVAFDGFVGGNKIVYDRVAPYRSLYPHNKFNKGDKLRVEDKEIFILKNGKIIHKIRKKGKSDGIIIDFTN